MSKPSTHWRKTKKTNSHEKFNNHSFIGLHRPIGECTENH